MKKVRNSLKYANGQPLPYEVALDRTVSKIKKASRLGEGVRLTAEEIRALDWCLIRADSGIENVEQFRDGSCEELADA